MANLLRSAKCGSNWTDHDLTSYNISLHPQDIASFFGMDHLPLPPVDQELLETLEAKDMVNDSYAELVGLLDEASLYTSQESAVVDFAMALFRSLGYVHRRRVARSRMDMPLYICGEERHAKGDVCLVELKENSVCLLVQEDKRAEDGRSRGSADDKLGLGAAPQLVAQAIAAFDCNNQKREAAGLERLTQKVMPGITMVGTTPTFFKIPVTEELAAHVRCGTYPPDSTTVTLYQPLLPTPDGGMKPLNNRQLLLCCYEAFKSVVGI